MSEYSLVPNASGSWSLSLPGPGGSFRKESGMLLLSMTKDCISHVGSFHIFISGSRPVSVVVGFLDSVLVDYLYSAPRGST